MSRNLLRGPIPSAIGFGMKIACFIYAAYGTKFSTGASILKDQEKRPRPLKSSLAPRFQKKLGLREKDPSSDTSLGDVEGLDTIYHALLEDAIAVSASDLHLDPGAEDFCLRMRVDGALHDAVLIPKTLSERMLNHFKVQAQLDPGPVIRPSEGWAEYQLDERKIHLRISCMPTVSGDKLAIRIFDAGRIRAEMTELGMNAKQSNLIQEWLGNIQGLFLVVGAVGSGKSTTLYALLNQLRKQTRSVVSIEDPVEYRIEGVNQVQVSPETDFDFPQALRSVMRLDPDDIMFGEIRDPLSAAAAVDAAATGKVLLSTLHSRDAVGAVMSLRNYGVKDHEIAALLETVVSQRLVRTLCDDCKKEVPVSDHDKAWLKSIGRKTPKTLYAAAPEGCGNCGGIGYRGRTGVFEVWRLREKEKALIIEHPAEQVLRQQVRDWGLPSLFDAAWNLLTSGTTSLDEIRPLCGFVAKEE